MLVYGKLPTGAHFSGTVTHAPKLHVKSRSVHSLLHIVVYRLSWQDSGNLLYSHKFTR